MAPGSIGALAQSDAIAFRAEFTGAIPPPRQLYWRALVMENFDGLAWHALERTRVRPSLASFTGIGAATQYRVTLEPHNRHWLFALDLPGRIPQDTQLAPAYQLRSAQPVTTRIRYDAASYLEYRAALDASLAQLDTTLVLPANNPHTLELGRAMRRQAGTPIDTVNAALAWFRNEPFRYTLNPPVLGDDPVDEFLFDTRAGFCEHYAGAFALLMRAAGIPARVVTGYQGGEINPVGNYLMVRQSDAHAWVEVWLAGRGWTRIDPTAAVSPSRVERGIHSALPETGLIAGLINPQQFTLLAGLRLNWDAFNNQWNQWVLGYNVERQKFVLSRLGMPQVNWQNMALALFWISGAIVFVLTLFMLRKNGWRPRRDPVAKAYERFCRMLAKVGVARLPHEGPLAFSARAQAARPDLARVIEQISLLYADLRYGAALDRRVNELEQLVRTLHV
jgi:transglutaminase-like putative cysteine protease